MDYTKQSPWQKLRKGLRYVRLYGPRRTWAKIQGQYHKKRRFESLPSLPDPVPSGGHVGFIGCGNFAFTTLGYYVRKNFGRVFRGAMDTDIHAAASMYERYGFRYYTDDAERILRDPEIDLIFIASYHSSHADYAVRALEAGKHVHIEKPHVVTEEQLRDLCRAMEASTGKVTLGFNRPLSRYVAKIQEHLGTQAGSAMLNWSVFGHAIPPDHWYARPEEGGRVFGNLCHWTDLVYHLVPAESRYPIRIIPARWETPDVDIACSLVFGDGSLASITFSSKGQTFEGVRESLTAQRGDVMLWLEDFQSLRVEHGERKLRFRTFYRDHGHEARARASYELSRGSAGETVAYVWETGELFLRADQALRRNEPVEVHAFDRERLQRPGTKTGSPA